MISEVISAAVVWSLIVLAGFLGRCCTAAYGGGDWSCCRPAAGRRGKPQRVGQGCTHAAPHSVRGPGYRQP